MQTSEKFTDLLKLFYNFVSMVGVSTVVFELLLCTCKSHALLFDKMIYKMYLFNILKGIVPLATSGLLRLDYVELALPVADQRGINLKHFGNLTD